MSPGGLATYNVVVSNNGTVDLTDVSARLTSPLGVRSLDDAPGGLECGSNTCDPGEFGEWTIPTSAPGKTQLLTVRTQVVDDPDSGDIVRLSVWGFATVTNDISGEVDVLIGEFHGPDTSGADVAFESPGQFQARRFPSPLTAQATFEIATPQATDARLRVYDISGRLVRTVFEGRLPVGTEAIAWDARDLQNGIYSYRVESAGHATQYGRVLKMQ